jgi:uncharacterized repeat protein (TIGR03803 family)
MRRVSLIPALLVVFAASSASAATLKTLYSFCRKTDCADGAAPQGIAFGSSGNIFGLTFNAQDVPHGSVLYELAPSGTGERWREKVLHDFCRRPNCTDGFAAFSLTADTHGNFFGGTEDGPGDRGLVYELLPDGSKDGWNYQVIYDFCSQQDCADGHHGDGAMAIDTAGNLYGTAYEGGVHHKGVVYELSPTADRHGWSETVLYDFCAKRRACVDGDQPVGGVTYAGAAHGLPYDGVSPLYGVTTKGGNRQHGVVFSLMPAKGGGWKEQVLFAFCREQDDCPSGAAPVDTGPLAIDAAGNLYGATYSGGDNFDGVVYELSPSSSPKWTETVLHVFDSSPFPQSNPIFDASGNLYGTTTAYVYQLVPNGMQSQFSETYQFCSLANCADGTDPQSALLIDASGNLYGTTLSGGAHNQGTVYELTP